MRWDERQLAMLREMGIRVWARDEPVPAAEAAGATAVAERAPPPPAPVARPPAADVAGELAAAEWLVVGEPFDAGGEAVAAADVERLLDNMLAAIRVARDAPSPARRASHLALAEGRSVDLDAAIAQVAPRGILALGRAAANAVLGSEEPLGRLRERVHDRAGVPVVVTFPLTYLLRHADDKAKAWADLCRAVAAVG